MTNKVARTSCSVCHTLTPKNEMVLQKYVEHSGSSIGGSFNPNKSNSTRLSGREYYRNKKRWVCNTCWKSRPNYLLTLILTIVAGPFFIPRYKGFGGFKSLLYALTLGGFLIGWGLSVLNALLGSLPNKDGLNNNKLL